MSAAARRAQGASAPVGRTARWAERTLGKLRCSGSGLRCWPCCARSIQPAQAWQPPLPPTPARRVQAPHAHSGLPRLPAPRSGFGGGFPPAPAYGGAAPYQPALPAPPGLGGLVGGAAGALGRVNRGTEQAALGVRVGEFHALNPHAAFVHPAAALRLQQLWDAGNELVRAERADLPRAARCASKPRACGPACATHDGLRRLCLLNPGSPLVPPSFEHSLLNLFPFHAHPAAQVSLLDEKAWEGLAQLDAGDAVSLVDETGGKLAAGAIRNVNAFVMVSGRRRSARDSRPVARAPGEA